MDTTDIERRLQELEERDAADTPDPADEIADELAALLDEEPPEGADS